MNAHLSMEGSELLLNCSDMHTTLARQIPGMRFDRKRKVWVAPLSPLQVEAAFSIFHRRLDLSPSLIDYMRECVTSAQYLSELQTGIHDYLDPDLQKDLWPLQVTGVKFLVDAKTAYLCDDMGSGKTIQCYRALDATQAYPALVVANKSALRSAWELEAERWCSTCEEVVVVDGGAASRRKSLERVAELASAGRAVVCVIGWEVLRMHSRLSSYGNVSLSEDERTEKELNHIPFRTVVIDEAHKAKNWESKRTRALWQVAHAPGVEYRWALTGTPITGYEEDVWAIGHTVQPNFYPRKRAWFDRYVNWKTLPGQTYPIVMGFEPSTYPEMLKWLKPFMLRRTKAEIIPDYQGKLPIRTIHVEMGGAQKRAYRQMEEHMLARGEDGILAAPSPIEQLLRLNQFAAATPKIEEGEDGDLKVSALTTPSCKVDALLEILDELGEAPAVVFAESRLLIDLVDAALLKHGVPHMRITGAESSRERAVNVQAFQEGHVRVALCTYGAGAESITLNKADTVIRLQRSYNFVSDTQAPDRVDRGERSVPVQVIDVVTLGTTEHAVHDRVDEKHDVFQQVVRDELKLRV